MRHCFSPPWMFYYCVYHRSSVWLYVEIRNDRAIFERALESNHETIEDDTPRLGGISKLCNRIWFWTPNWKLQNPVSTLWSCHQATSQYYVGANPQHLKWFSPSQTQIGNGHWISLSRNETEQKCSTHKHQTQMEKRRLDKEWRCINRLRVRETPGKGKIALLNSH